MNIDMYY